MPTVGTIYNPASDELKDRVRAFKSVVVAYEQISTAGAPELFGEAQDISAAKKVIRQSMIEATQAIGTRDLDLAEQMGLLTDKQVRDYSILKQKLEFESLSQAKTSSQSDSSSQKQ